MLFRPHMRGLNNSHRSLTKTGTLSTGHIGTPGTSPAVSSATTACNRRERTSRSLRGGRSDTRHGGDNGTPPTKPGPGSAEARTGEASCGLKENRGSFRVRYSRSLVFYETNFDNPKTSTILCLAVLLLRTGDTPVRTTKPPSVPKEILKNDLLSK